MIERILDSAQAIMRESGVNSLSLVALAKSLGIQPPSLYEYFDGKNALYEALYSRGVDRFQALIFQAIEEATDFEECCLAIFRSFLGFAKDSPELSRLLFSNPVAEFSPSPSAVSKTQDGLERGFKTVAGFMKEEGIEPPIDSSMATFIIEVFMHGLAAHALLQSKNEPVDVSSYTPVIKSFITLMSSRRGGDKH